MFDSYQQMGEGVHEHSYMKRDYVLLKNFDGQWFPSYNFSWLTTPLTAFRVGLCHGWELLRKSERKKERKKNERWKLKQDNCAKVEKKDGYGAERWPFSFPPSSFPCGWNGKKQWCGNQRSKRNREKEINSHISNSLTSLPLPWPWYCTPGRGTQIWLLNPSIAKGLRVRLWWIWRIFHREFTWDLCWAGPFLMPPLPTL